MLHGLLREGPVPIREPKTVAQKKAMIDLVKWASEKMGVDHPTLVNALKKAIRQNDWDDVMDLLSTYYMMKGIKSYRAQS